MANNKGWAGNWKIRASLNRPVLLQGQPPSWAWRWVSTKRDGLRSGSFFVSVCHSTICTHEKDCRQQEPLSSSLPFPCSFIYVYAFVYVYVCICIYVHIYIYICIYRISQSQSQSHSWSLNHDLNLSYTLRSTSRHAQQALFSQMKRLVQVNNRGHNDRKNSTHHTWYANIFTCMHLSDNCESAAASAANQALIVLLVRTADDLLALANCSSLSRTISLLF